MHQDLLLRQSQIASQDKNSTTAEKVKNEGEKEEEMKH